MKVGLVACFRELDLSQAAMWGNKQYDPQIAVQPPYSTRNGEKLLLTP